MTTATPWENKKFKSFLRGLKRAIAFISVAYLFGLSSLLLAQENNDEWKKVFEDLAESLSSRSEQALDYTSLLEELEELQANPVTINTEDIITGFYSKDTESELGGAVGAFNFTLANDPTTS
ncbi:MAG: hypothetical protein U9N53_10600, partial [Bacteroidota bacterium]|nr:hypothetical protein [Bacteroidota bacterium]